MIRKSGQKPLKFIRSAMTDTATSWTICPALHAFIFTAQIINFEIYLLQDTGTEFCIVHACWFISPEQYCFMPVDNLQQVVRFLVFTRVNHGGY